MDKVGLHDEELSSEVIADLFRDNFNWGPASNRNPLLSVQTPGLFLCPPPQSLKNLGPRSRAEPAPPRRFL